MTGRLAGKVICVTGAGRGQGRAHAVRMAEEGADIIAIDICEHIDTVMYDMATIEDLEETARQVEKLDRRISFAKADIRDLEGLTSAIDRGVADLGRLDVLVANAGIFAGAASALEVTDAQWDDTIATNLKGTWNTIRAGVPHIVAGGRGGSVILTSSNVALKGMPNIIHYSASKYGVIGLMRTLAVELASQNIRVNTIHPTSIDTPMAKNLYTYKMFRPDIVEPTLDDVKGVYQDLNLLPIDFIDPDYIAYAGVYLASDESRYVTGVAFPMDAGSSIK